MNNSVSKIIRLSILASVFTLFLASCEKENFDVVEEEVVETIEPTMKVTIGNRSVEYDAYALYCAGEDGTVFLSVSNNQVLLDTVLLVEDFMVDDFLIYYANDGTAASTIGGATFTENIGGTEITTVVLDGAAVITLEEANEQYVQGSMTGVFQLFSGAEVEYSVEFTAEVVGVSPWCN